MADMDADPPTTTTTIPADVRKNMNVLLKMLNDQLEIEVMDPESRINLVEAMWKAMGYSSKGNAIVKLKKTLTKGILSVMVKFCVPQNNNRCIWHFRKTTIVKFCVPQNNNRCIWHFRPITLHNLLQELIIRPRRSEMQKSDVERRYTN